MSSIQNKIHEMYALERLSEGTTAIHRLHPITKLFSAVIFIVTVVSFDRYSFERLVPYIFYPVILMALSEIPYSMLHKRFLIALPFCLFAGMSNLIFDRALAFTVAGVSISNGAVSFATLLYRSYLCVMAVLILVATTSISGISECLRRLHVPNIFVTVLEMTYRYISVLMEEAHSMITAYSLRSTNKKGLEMRHMGSFVGQLMLRSFDRAERVYQAMKCRGYALMTMPDKRIRLQYPDIVFTLAVLCFCVFFRLSSIDALINSISGAFG